ncbi:alpha/beta fold hydrolase [Pararhodobacter sp. SW119]|uniref:alpha/beta hydrolase n=1 Tax=Pararhodobacter sp. SW119 TaxID=2780075 RepID=UPI001AE0211F|nr:alpha/beta fold hydrolase [Pararhodobacter sp. SW119]
MVWFVKLILGAVAIYAVLIAVLALAQTALLFPRWAMGPGPDLPPGAERLEVARPDGVVLVGHRLRPAGGAEGAPVLLGFGGNAWDGAAMARYLAQVFPEHEVVAFHYRGYGPSTGRPGAAALLADAVAIFDDLEAGRVVVVGFSIGAGPAAHLAGARPVAGLVLVTAFDSLTALAGAHYPWVPVRLLLRHRMAPAADLAGADLPVALITAARDSIVPAARTEALRAALRAGAPRLVFDETVAAGHNDLYGEAAFTRALRAAVAAVAD